MRARCTYEHVPHMSVAYQRRTPARIYHMLLDSKWITVNISSVQRYMTNSVLHADGGHTRGRQSPAAHTLIDLDSNSVPSLFNLLKHTSTRPYQFPCVFTPLYGHCVYPCVTLYFAELGFVGAPN